MIVRDDDTHWQIVRQPDHAALAGRLAAAWGGGSGFAALPATGSVVRACAHHDDGWLAWELAPVLDGDGMPKTFFKVPTSRQMDFYRGVIAALDDIDPHAALLTVMHACGLYGMETGWRMTAVADSYRAAAERFITEFASQIEPRRARLAIPSDELWRDFHLLQVVDRLSLHVCMRPDDGEQVIQRIVTADGSERPLHVQGRGGGTIALSPYPFAGRELVVTLRRLMLPKRPFADDDDLRAALARATLEDRPLRFIAA